MNIPRVITAERLRELMDYNPDTGLFFWRVARGRGVQPGDEAGYLAKDGRGRIQVEGRPYLRYRLAWLWMKGEWPANDIDHIDGNPSNDRFSNLRDVTNLVNSQNRRAPSIAKRVGTLLGTQYRPFQRKKPWNARIQCAGKSFSLGYFATEQEAHAAYIKAKREMHEGCTL